MAYGALYRFPFYSADGALVEITVYKDGYTGTAKTRGISSAKLRRESDGLIMGSSLEWSAVAEEESEYAELYTTDPVKYKVEVDFNGGTVWSGFITPELYAEPWIDAPYDTTLTATDNIAELKNKNFEGTGDILLAGLLTKLLKISGRADNVLLATSNLKADGVGLLSLTVNLDHLTGETCYDVLESLLRTFHARLLLYAPDKWMIIRETDVTAAGLSSETLASLASDSDLWPVGNMSAEIVPARKEIEVKQGLSYSVNLMDRNSKAQWSYAGNATQLDGRIDLLPKTAGGGSTPQYVTDAPAAVAKVLLGDVGGRTYSVSFAAASLPFSLFTGGTQPFRQYWGVRVGLCVKAELSLEDGTTKTVYFGDNGADVDDETVNYFQSGKISSRGGGSAAAVEYEFVFPAKVSGKAVVGLSDRLVLSFSVEGGTGHIIISDLELACTSLPESVTTLVRLDNGARGASDEVELEAGNYLPADMDNTVKANGKVAASFASAAVAAVDKFDVFMAYDYALSCAVPRMRLTGIMAHRSADSWKLPLCVRTTYTTAANLVYMVEEFCFDLVNGEIDLSMLSLPAAALSVSSVEVNEDYSETSDGRDGRDGRDGTDGNDGAAAGFGTPTATAVALPSGSAPTASVAASGPDTAKIFAFTFGLPQGSSGAAVDIAARLAAPPRLVLRTGDNEDQTYEEGIQVSHPMLGQRGYEAVLMVYGKNSRRSGVSSGGGKLRVHKRGWAVALGNLPLTGHVPLTGAADAIGVDYGFKMSGLRDFIVKRFCHDTQYSAAQLYARDYAQWISEKRDNRGFNAFASNRLFGVAVRCANPDFDAILIAGKELKATTQMIGDTPRYLYSPVAPLRAVWSSSVPTQRFKDVLGFSLTL